jgi:hypothetical protein
MQIQKILIDETEVFRITELLDPKQFIMVSKFIENQFIDSNGTGVDLSKGSPDIVYQFILKSIKEAFKKLDVIAEPNGFCVSRNRGVDHWHIHVGEFENDPKPIIPEKFYVALYYPHRFWDPQYGGNLLLGKTKESSIYSFPCVSNSCIIHNNLIGHDLDFLNLEEAPSNRIVMYSHWVNHLK